MDQFEIRDQNLNNTSHNSNYRYDMIQPLRRRKQVETSSSKKFKIEVPPNDVVTPMKLAVLLRLIVWLSGGTWHMFNLLIGAVLRRNSTAEKAVRLRRILEKMGPAAIKVGQQLSVRADLLPFEYCTELSKMLDKMEPFDVNRAIETIERNTGKPLPETFLTFDPVPIGSASLACVYQAKLHNGDLVAVKVKRPGIARKLNADLQAISLICIAMEWFGVVRVGLTKNFRDELTRMFSDEVNFFLEARYTEIFRKQCKNEKYVSAPKIYPHLCGEDVIVTEFVSGVFMVEILSALEQGDDEQRRKLEARGFNFKKIAKRMFHIFQWEYQETYFFHADPHPANLIVRPDNTLVMIDFGSCGSISKKTARKLSVFNRQMVLEDFHAMAQTTVAMLEPLPPIDTDSFTNGLINVYRDVFIAGKSTNAKWYEKCFGGMWMRVLSLTREYNIPMTLDSVRMFRATFMYDSIIYRLWADLKPRSEYIKWARKFNKKKKKFVGKFLRKRILGPETDDYTRMVELTLLTEQTLQRFQHFLDTPKHNFGYSVSKVAYVCSTVLNTTVRMIGLYLILVLAKMGQILYLAKGGIPDFYVPEILFSVAIHPVFLFISLLYTLLIIRRITLRMDDLDVDTST